MIAPAASFIELGAAALKGADPANLIRKAQARELYRYGEKVTELGASGMTDEVVIGYNLGVETCRMVVNSMPVMVRAGVEL